MRIVILRGHSGSGKSTYAKKLCNLLPENKKSVICSADNYFIKDGEYKFDYQKLNEAHAYCFAKFYVAVEQRCDLIIVDNTNTRLFEISPYIMFARIKETPADLIEVITLSCSVSLAADRNIHGVPRGSIENMKKRFERLPSYWPEETVIYTNK